LKLWTRTPIKASFCQLAINLSN